MSAPLPPFGTSRSQAVRAVGHLALLGISRRSAVCAVLRTRARRFRSLRRFGQGLVSIQELGMAWPSTARFDIVAIIERFMIRCIVDRCTTTFWWAPRRTRCDAASGTPNDRRRSISPPTGFLFHWYAPRDRRRIGAGRSRPGRPDSRTLSQIRCFAVHPRHRRQHPPLAGGPPAREP
jgi:hypothetical protein